VGWEFAGVVSAVGAAVARFKVCDRVFGTADMTRDGCWAESVAVCGKPVNHRNCRYIPASSEFDGKGINANDRRQKPACAV
jgi:NADPH:quinone reductase-like Zn-dependent oxidoreductase